MPETKTTERPFYKVLFTRCDSDDKKVIRVNTLDGVQDYADGMGRQGWVLKEVTPTPHRAKVQWFGQTHFEFSNNLPAKRGWFFSCPCGDEDSTGTKTGIIEIAKNHTANVIVHHKNGNATVLS